MCREQESNKACNCRGRACHYVTACRIHQLTQGKVLIGYPGGNHVDGCIDSDTESHRDDNHVVDADFAELKRGGQVSEEPECEENAHAK